MLPLNRFLPKPPQPKGPKKKGPPGGVGAARTPGRGGFGGRGKNTFIIKFKPLSINDLNIMRLEMNSQYELELKTKK